MDRRLVSLGSTFVLAAAVGLSAAIPPAGAAATVSRYGLSAPAATVAYGGALYIANSGNNTLTMVNGSTGALLARVGGASYGFSHPDALAVVPGLLVVANRTGSSLTVLDLRTRHLVRRIASSLLVDPVAITAAGSDVVVLSGWGRVAVVNPGTGAILRLSAGAAFRFARPTGLAVAGGHIFVTNQAGASVTMIDFATGHLLQVLADKKYGFGMPTGAAAVGSLVWITNWSNQSVTAVSAANGAFVHQIVNGNFVQPGPITSGDGYLFTASPPGWSPMVTQVTLSTLSVNWMMCNTNGVLYNFAYPQSLTVVGRYLWVSNETGNTLTEMDAVSGAAIRDLV